MPAHTQLTWVLGCITGFGEASRMTQFKDKSARSGADRASVGLFTYPILQAADILAYHADAVPVGEDQRQHLELTRNLAQRFNSRFGDDPHRAGAVHPGVDRQDLRPDRAARKMSKTLPGGALDLLAPVAESVKKIKSAVTDTERDIRYDEQHKPGVSNLLALLSEFTGTKIPQLEQDYEGKGYGQLKADLADAFIEFVTPVQERVSGLPGDPGELDRTLAVGTNRAREVAEATLASVYEKVGLLGH